jgi:hypothetical protein
MLEGKIGDFSLPDIFQLIALTKKSGALNISSDQQQGRILFKGGEVCFAVADVARVAIGARLVQAGLVSEDQVIEVLEAKRGEGAEGSAVPGAPRGRRGRRGRARLVHALLDRGRGLRPHAAHRGEFAFDASEEADTSVGMTVSTEHLIIEGGRRMGEWAAIREHVPATTSSWRSRRPPVAGSP